MISDLNRRIIIQQPLKVADGAGGFTSSWQNINNSAEIYASIVPLSSAEILHFSQLSHEVNYQIIIRYRDDITTTMRIKHKGVVYNIKSIINVQGRDKYLKILAQARE